MRVAGVNIPDNKRIDIALTYIYGVGRGNVYKLLEKANIDPARLATALSEEELGRILKVLDQQKIEGELRAEIKGNIDRLRQISAYRGVRHIKGLPVRGQRTRSNARTKRGKRVTIGAIRKEVAEKMAAVKK